jgi:two-component system cell cycle sensor histidine kinase/response regulator CckA
LRTPNKTRRFLLLSRQTNAWEWGGIAFALIALAASLGSQFRPGAGHLLDLVVVLAALLWFGHAVMAAARRVSALRRRDLLGVQAFACVLDEAGRVLVANEQAHALLGGSRQPLARLAAAVVPEDRDEIDRLAAAAKLGERSEVEIRVKLDPKAEAAAPALLRVGPVKEPAGAVYWGIEPITADQEALRLTARRRALVGTLIEEVPVGLYALDADGRFVWANAVFADWLGVPADTLVAGGARLADFLPEDAASAAPELVEPMAGRELVLLSRRGQSLPLRLHQAMHQDEAGSYTCSIALLEVPAQDERAGLAHQRFQRFFEFAPVGIAFADAGARFRETNHALDVFLGASPVELRTRSLYDFAQEDDHGAITARLATTIADAGTADAVVKPLEIRLKAPRERVVALFASRLEAPDGSAGGLILYLMDLTEQKNLELQFVQSQKMQAVGQLAGGVAHDFNNLLTAMNGFCDLLLLRFRPGDQSFGDLMQIKQNANRAASLVRQLLAFSRQQTLQPRVIDVSEVLGELSHLLNRLLGETVELKLYHGRGLGRVKVDPGQLEQVIINLAVNARDAMSRSGALTIRTENVDLDEPIQREAERVPAGSYVRIEVTDDGAGIPPEIIGRIFEPFFSTKDVGSGTGLGLSMVYGIVTQTGGFVLVDSTIGVGTRFSIYLPRWLDKGEEETARTVQPEPVVPRDLTGAGTVLLVEDEAPVRMFTVRALQNKGYTVLEAKSGDAALEILAEPSTPPIDLVITDVMMPRMDGPTLIEHIRARLPTVKVIFISGYAEETFAKRIEPGTAVHFLPKPFSLKELAAKVKEIMSAGTPP